ncbi:MAG: hypothetical protein GC187_00425 [Alphaproteobacteria bacterium]|nr:hypothetical protein [Alphaproteobacteria bacterium]
MSQWDDNAGEEESSFISMADMMVGLLLIFIILLTYYVLQSREAVAAAERVKRVEEAASEARGLVLNRIRERVDDDRIKFDPATGTIRFSQDVLTFASGDDSIPATAEPLLVAMADALAETIPCLAFLSAPREALDCSWIEREFSELTVNGRRLGTLEQFRNLAAPLIWVDGVYIEGHTDCTPFPGDPDGFRNWVLGAQRATRTYLYMNGHNPDLSRIFSKSPFNPDTDQAAQRVFGVASYADRRPARDFDADGYPSDPRLADDFRSACGALGAEQNERNRRIDIRISMGWTAAAEGTQ